MLKSISFIFGENFLQVGDGDKVFEELHIYRMLPEHLIVLRKQCEVACIIGFFRMSRKCLELHVGTRYLLDELLEVVALGLQVELMHQSWIILELS